jgi:hypothetical protein
MNKETAKLYLPMVKALSEGKTIQYLENGEWSDILLPSFSSGDVERYKIKPDLMEFYTITNKDKTNILSVTYETEKEAKEYINEKDFKSYAIVVHMREVE